MYLVTLSRGFKPDPTTAPPGIPWQTYTYKYTYTNEPFLTMTTHNLEPKDIYIFMAYIYLMEVFFKWKPPVVLLIDIFGVEQIKI